MHVQSEFFDLFKMVSQRCLRRRYRSRRTIQPKDMGLRPLPLVSDIRLHSVLLYSKCNWLWHGHHLIPATGHMKYEKKSDKIALYLRAECKKYFKSDDINVTMISLR